MTLKRRLILFLTVFAVCVCSLGVALINVNAQDAQLSDVNYQQIYVVGETVEIEDATISYGGTDYPASASVIYPNGKVYALDEITLTESGIYTVEYRANVGNKVFVKKVTFTVSDKLFFIDGSGEYSYGKNSYLGDMNGINVSLTSGAVLRYNKVIDVSDNIQGIEPIIRMYCTPQIKGEREVERVRVTLTDVYDSENYVEVLYKGSTVDQYTYTTGNANGQLPTGLHWSATMGSSSIAYDGGICRVYQNSDAYGFNGRSSFSGNVPTGLTMEDNYFELNMDYDMRRLYVQRAVVDASKNLLVDLDEPLFFGENLWNGFTTGEVVVTVEGLSYNSSNFNFFITELDGHNLASAGTDNQTPPAITVDFGEYAENNLPMTIVGHATNVFPAVAFDDLEGEIECFTSVYYNYNNSSRISVNVVDGSFKPTRAGVYTVVYKAEDSFGNQTIKTVELNAIERTQIEYEFSAHQTQFSVGGEISVAQVTILNSLPGYTVDVKARLKNSDVEYDVSEKMLKFTPIYAGVYSIDYIYSDYVETQTFSYDITVSSSDKPVFFGDAIVPRYFIKNCTYYIPDYYAYDYSDGVKTVKADIFISADGEEESLLNGNSVTIEAQNTFAVIYKVGKTTKTYLGNVVDTNYGESGNVAFDKYLQGSAFSSLAGQTGITYSTNKALTTDGVAKLELINSAYLNLFNVEFNVVENNFEKFNIILSSDNDRHKKIIISYAKNSSETTDVTIVYGDITITGVSSSSFESGNAFQVSVYQNNLVVYGSDIAIPIEQVFEGFSNKFFMDFEMEGISGNASVKFNKLMNQSLSDLRDDSVLPTIIYTPLGDNYKLGDTINIQPFDAYDFVDPSPSFKYNVLDGNNQIMTSVDGVILNGISNDYRTMHQVLIEDYGTIRLVFNIKDYSSKNTIGALTTTIEDTVAPVIELNVKKTVYGVGNITVADYTVSDETKSEVSVTIMVINADGNIKVIDGNKFNADKKGAYTVIFRATDLNGNIAFAQYTLTVK